ncbi:MAG: hypothetical protein ACUVTZ_03555 [Armatimonadota bacterium]
MDHEMTRRELIQSAAVAVSALSSSACGANASTAPRKLPTIKLGKLEVSRLILGSNPFFGFSHQTPALDEEMKAYHTDERIMQVLDEAAKHGITAVAAPPYERWISLFRKYLDSGGKLRIWIAQPDTDPDHMLQAIDESANGGAKAIFIQGGRVDEQFQNDPQLFTLRRWLEAIRKHGLPAGMASHRPDVHLAAEKLGLPTDFYFQCFFQPDTYRMEDRDKAVAAIKQIRKPVVGYKILAAGRIPPEEGFAFAFRHLKRKDGVCVGMYLKRKPSMVQENVQITLRQQT